MVYAGAIVLVVSALFPGGARAGGLETAWGEAQASFKKLGLARPGQFKVLEPELAIPEVGREMQSPRRADDPFLLPGCSAVDALYFRAFSLPEAVSALQGCAKAISSRYRIELVLREGLIPPPPGMPHASMGLGIELIVRGELPPGNGVLVDLGHALSRRRNVLLGHPAVVRYQP